MIMKWLTTFISVITYLHCEKVYVFPEAKILLECNATTVYLHLLYQEGCNMTEWRIAEEKLKYPAEQTQNLPTLCCGIRSHNVIN